jgi:hypothetical protein
MIITLVQGTRLDALLPRDDFSEPHSRVIRAESSAVYPAFKTLTLHEMTAHACCFRQSEIAHPSISFWIWGSLCWLMCQEKS